MAKEDKYQGKLKEGDFRMFRKLNSSHSKNPSERKLIGRCSKRLPLLGPSFPVFGGSQEKVGLDYPSMF